LRSYTKCNVLANASGGTVRRRSRRQRSSYPSPGLRLLYVGMALTPVNIWVDLKWAFLGCPRRGGREMGAKLFPLRVKPSRAAGGLRLPADGPIYPTDNCTVLEIDLE